MKVWRGVERRDDNELRREIELRRMMGVRALEGAAEIKGKGKVTDRLPHDVWHVIGEYMETLSVIKLEKTCKSIYVKYNKKCVDCDQETLTLSPKCTNYWRR